MTALDSSCATCGAALDVDTVTSPGDAAVGTATATRRRLGRFPPGTVLAARYRIVGLLGRGGMGEVYRAEDLTLDQDVALKFLPDSVARDEGALSRFHNEVRLARQIAHPNVCRVYDIGQVAGEPFLSMEYVDGEDLASLLRRIGRLPADKAIELARQLCAGLATAHDNGILHRDLKPANVMIDGRGRLKITDFGLAQLVGSGAEMAGTPAYMAPEQLSGASATVRSDIYALGLIIYEMVAGRAAFASRSFGERARDREATPTPLSSVAHEVDPAVERVVTRCLEVDPRARPASALAVSAALPGGDPLAAALAAGETPSPELVAAAGDVGALRPRTAWGLAAAIGVELAIYLLIGLAFTLHHLVPFDMPPQVLASHARTTLRDVARIADPADTAYGFAENFDYPLFAAREGVQTDRWAHLRHGRPAGLLFWYREADDPMVPWSAAWPITPEDPPPAPGMRSVMLDTRGRLLELTVEHSGPIGEGSAAAADWTPLFAAAGIDLSRFAPATPDRAPPVYADAIASWTGSFPEAPQWTIRVDAASLRGTPVFFAVRGPWMPDVRSGSGTVVEQYRYLFTVLIVIGLLLVCGGILLALRNLRLGRGDASGAMRLAVVILLLSLAEILLSAHHVARPVEEFRVLTGAFGFSLTIAASTWAIYLALEPYVRRRWPDRIVSWTRLLAGRWRDPMVGRDVLIGGALAGVAVLVGLIQEAIGTAMGATPGMMWSVAPDSFAGLRGALAMLASVARSAVTAGLIFMFLLVAFTILLRRRTAAAVAFWLLVTVVFTLAAITPIDRAFAWLPATMAIVLVVRFGLLAIIAFHVYLFTFQRLPLEIDFSVWYAGQALLGLMVLLVLTVYGVHASLAGRPLAAFQLPDDL